MTDPFGQPTSGGFPKVEDMEGKLLLIVPEKIERVRNRFAKPTDPDPTQDRATADVTVFEEDGTWETHQSMYLSQTVLLNACRSALKPGNPPMVLARLVKLATKETREALKIDDTPEAFAAARAEWLKKGGKGTEPRHVWVLQPHTEDDAAKARKYLATKDPFATAS